MATPKTMQRSSFALSLTALTFTLSAFASSAIMAHDHGTSSVGRIAVERAEAAPSTEAMQTLEEVCAQTRLECAIDSAGAVVGKPGTTAPYRYSIGRAASLYNRHFDAPAPFTLIWLGSALSPSDKDRLSVHFPAVLPWMTPADRQDFIKAKIRDKVESELRTRFPNLPKPKFDAIVARSLEASLAANQPQSSADANDDENTSENDIAIHHGALAHELGHIFFMNSYWATEKAAQKANQQLSNIDKVRQYGGPADDWLDEMAAILLENETITIGRRKALSKRLTANGLDAIWPLDEFFTMQHPVFTQAKALVEAKRKASGGKLKTGMLTMSKEELDERADGRIASSFYAQARAFCDFMIERTGDPYIFAKITDFLIKGHKMDKWLDQHGQYMSLPRTIEALDQDFKAYVDDRYSRPVATVSIE